MSDVRSKVARGAAWMVVARLCDRTLGLVSIVILARLLLPEDFGIVAMAMSVIALLNLLRRLRFDQQGLVLSAKFHRVGNQNSDQCRNQAAGDRLIFHGSSSKICVAPLRQCYSPFSSAPK